MEWRLFVFLLKYALVLFAELVDILVLLAYIINKIKDAESGAKFAVGTEINLVNRLQATYPDKDIKSLSPYQCLCTTMYRVRPRWLLASLRAIKNKKPINVIKVDEETTKYSMLALDKMLELS